MRGGYGLILRLDPNRTSNDIDVVYIDAAGAHATALAALDTACRADLGDFFSFAILAVDDEREGRARSASLIARLGVREWSRFTADLALPRADVPAEPLIDAPGLTGLAIIDDVPPGLGLLAWEQQVAEKCCGLFERHGATQSGRLRDLLDLAMIAQQVDGLDGTLLADALVHELERRPLLADGLPGTAELDSERRRAWATASRRATRSAPITLNDAELIVRAFLDPVLRGRVRATCWHADRATWLPPRDTPNSGRG